jgi:hypothetical protein
MVSRHILSDLVRYVALILIDRFSYAIGLPNSPPTSSPKAEPRHYWTTCSEVSLIVPRRDLRLSTSRL